MPSASEFLSGFLLTSGTVLGGYSLSSATSTHETIKRYREYLYHITLVFKKSPGASYSNLFNAVMDEISQERVIWGVRNPYRCIIDPPQEGDIVEDPDGTITFHLVGHSYRA